MAKPCQEDQAEPIFGTEKAEAELIAAGSEFASPGHARAASIRNLFGWQPGETLRGRVSRHLEKAGAGSGRDLRGERV